MVSEWVPQENGVARGVDKTKLPIVLEDDLNLSAFIRDMKYLAVYRNPAECHLWFQGNILARAQRQQQTTSLVLLELGAALIFLLGQKLCRHCQ